MVLENLTERFGEYEVKVDVQTGIEVDRNMEGEWEGRSCVSSKITV